MSRQLEGHRVEDVTVVARRVLLDALAALREHSSGVVVVGAQAVYLRAELAGREELSSYTSDADLAIDRHGLADVPLIEEAMRAAGFHLQVRPGTWSRRESIGAGSGEVAVDLLIPEAFGGTAPRRARGGRIPPHADDATRQVRGLEAAIVDNDPVLIRSLDPGTASGTAPVAGIAALLVAKAHKIADRLAARDARPDRLQDKDAGDVVRLMQLGDVATVAARFRLLLEHDEVSEVVREGLELLRSQFGGRRTVGTTMAVAALAGSTPPDLVEALGAAYLRALPAG